MKEQNPSERRHIQSEQPLSVDEVYELIYKNEANENTIERYHRDEELFEMLDEALKAETD